MLEQSNRLALDLVAAMAKISSLESELRRLREVEKRARAFIEAASAPLASASASAEMWHYNQTSKAREALRSSLEARDGEKST